MMIVSGASLAASCPNLEGQASDEHRAAPRSAHAAVLQYHISGKQFMTSLTTSALETSSSGALRSSVCVRVCGWVGGWVS